jgi:ornithine cyclodeaminase
MTVLTALRTAATSAMAARHLAPKGARVMAVIGNGAQSEFQALAFKSVVGIEEVRLYDIDAAATSKCARNLAGSGLKVTPASPPRRRWKARRSSPPAPPTSSTPRS